MYPYEGDARKDSMQDLCMCVNLDRLYLGKDIRWEAELQKEG